MHNAPAQLLFCSLNLLFVDVLVPVVVVVSLSSLFGHHQESRPLARSNNGSPRFTNFPSLCACSEPSLTNLIGSGLNLLCLQIHSNPECRWTWPEVAILGAGQKERGLRRRECTSRRERGFGNFDVQYKTNLEPRSHSVLR